jgi:hypothetical protein
MTIGIDYFRKRAPGPPKSDPVRNAKIVERAAKGEKYNHIGKDFNLCGERIRQIVNRAKWEASLMTLRENAKGGQDT